MSTMHQQGSREQSSAQSDSSGVMEFLSARLPIRDLTRLAQTGRLPVAAGAFASSEEYRDSTGEPMDLFSYAALSLSRQRKRHLIVRGESGVGKTRFIEELARRAAVGEIPSLANHWMVWFDCHNVGPEDSRACLETILQVPNPTRPTTLCLDGLSHLIERPNGGTNLPLLRSAIEQPNVQVIGIVTDWEYQDLVARDARLLESFNICSVTEPDKENLLKIADAAQQRLQLVFDLGFEPGLSEVLVELADAYWINARFPQKMIRLLEHAFESVRFECQSGIRDAATVSRHDVERSVEDCTGSRIQRAEEIESSCGLHQQIEESLFGQPEAASAVGDELELIRSGLNDTGKPASVMLFAGLTGVGKTEMAKVLAKLYSNSGRLNVYTMGNFSEPHSVSGIIGVPPGYVGHDEGGRLINELNADPFAVFLLDEAEKAHANVWKAFLNLFDEGWIVDQRGRKARAERAIFILTTNAGERAIQQMHTEEKPYADIVSRVKQTLAKFKTERSSQPVFSPQFLARINQIVVFRPLSQAAMEAITRASLAEVQRRWQHKQDVAVEFDEGVAVRLAEYCFRCNQDARGQEGARYIRKTVRRLIELPLLRRRNADGDRTDDTKRVTVNAQAGGDDLGEPIFRMTFGEDTPTSLGAAR